MSHGCHEAIYGIDGRQVLEADIRATFTSQQCPALRGKPKMFIFQSCRGGISIILNKMPSFTYIDTLSYILIIVCVEEVGKIGNSKGD